MNAALTEAAQIKNPAAFEDAMRRLDAMAAKGVPKEIITARGNTWMRMIVSGKYTIDR